MNMFNYEVEAFTAFLISLELAGKTSRMRSKVCKILAAKISEIEEDRIALAKEFSEKDENDQPILEQSGDGREVFKMKDLNKFNVEYNVLLNETFVIDKTPDKIDMLETIKQAVLNTELIFSGREASLYDRWCEIVLDGEED